MNIAILSPNKNAYSETFIQVQKESLQGNVFYYFNGHIPSRLEGFGSITIKYAVLKRKLGLLSEDIRLESLKKSLLKNKIDVVLAQYGPTGNAVCQLCKTIKVPLVVHFHGYDASIRSVIKQNGNYTDLFRKAKKIIAVSKAMVSDLQNLGCPQEKIVYNPCAPKDLFLESKISKILKKQFIAVGRFTDKKAPYYTILAFNKVLQKHPDAKLIFGGDGVLLNTCINLTQYLNIENAVSFEGVISQDKLAKYLYESMAFVQHSITADNGDKEGTPVAVLEASAAGLPVLSTMHAGIPDVVLHKKTGLLCKEGDVDTMAKQMCYILDNPNEAELMGLNGKRFIKENFSLDKYIDKLQSILESTI